MHCISVVAVVFGLCVHLVTLRTRYYSIYEDIFQTFPRLPKLNRHLFVIKTTESENIACISSLTDGFHKEQE
jgi:hypothetical protein